MFRKTVLLLACILMCCTALPMATFAEAASVKNGDLVTLGEYPQTEITDACLLNKLNSFLQDKKTESDWQSYNYYSGNQGYGSMEPADYMKYIDIVIDGVKYRAVTFSEYRASGTLYWQSDEYSFQDNNGYYLGEIYWFAYEPVVWRVLDSNEGLLMSEFLLDTQAYNNCLYSNGCIDKEGSIHACNYEKSSLRQWLNGEFSNTAFNSSEKSLLVSKELDNTPFIPYYWMEWGNATNDKVFLLSHTDIMNENYSFNKDNVIDENRKAAGTDYAKCMGLPVDKKEDSSKWFLRSSSCNSETINAVNSLGIMDYCEGNSYCCYGIRPAIKLKSLKNTQSVDKSTIKNPSAIKSGQSSDETEENNITISYPKNSWIAYAAESFSSGHGTKESPYIITTAEELALMSKLVNSGIRKYQEAYYVLASDIDLSAHEWFPIGNQELQEASFLIKVQFDHSFLGVFNGGGHTISGMHIDNAYKLNYAYGLFGSSFGYITDVILEKPVIKINRTDLFPTSIVNAGLTYGMCVGSIAGEVQSTENTHHNLYNPMGIVKNCVIVDADIDVLSSTDITCGTVVGHTNGAVVYDCIANGNVDVYSAGCHVSVGGIVGYFSFSNATRCSFEGNIKSGNDYVKNDQGYYFPNKTGGAFGEFGSGSTVSDICVNGSIDYYNGIASIVGSFIGHAQHCNNSFAKYVATSINLVENGKKENACSILGNFPLYSWVPQYVNFKNVVGDANGTVSGVDDKYYEKYLAHSFVGRTTEDVEDYEYDILAPNHVKFKDGEEYYYFDESFSMTEVFADTLGFNENVWKFYEDEFPSLKIENRKDCKHTYDSGKVTVSPSCSGYGICEYTCTICQSIKTETIAKNSVHSYDNTCDDICNGCGATRSVTHKYTTTTTKATLTENGSIKTVCTVCGAVENEKTISMPVNFTLSATSYTYNGKVKTPTVTVKDSAGKVLTKGTDYTVTYASGRTVPDTYNVTVTMKGNYTGTKTLTFKINPISISTCTVKLSQTSYTYDGYVKTPTVTVKDSAGKALTKGTDYSVTYAAGRKTPGTYNVTVKMMGYYSGTKTLSFKINPIDISTCTVKLSATSYTYDGKVKTPTVSVINSYGTKLKSTNYTVTYSEDRKNAGTYNVKVTMKGNYTGTKTLSFKINPIDISTCTVKLSKASYTFDGYVKTPTVTVTNSNGTKLTKATNYTVTYSEGRKDAGTYKVTVKMKGNYTGTKTLTFKINPIDISTCTVKLSSTNYTYNGYVKTPTVSVVNSYGTKLKSTNYTVTYAAGRTAPGTYNVTVKMKGNYTGTKTLSFNITRADISTCTVKLSSTAFTYSGAVKTPSVIVTNSNGTKLTKDKHYTVTYSEGRKDIGTYKVTVKMLGNYTGTKTLTFKIKPIDISACNVKLSATSYTYNGYVKTPTVVVTNSYGTKLTKGTHYTVTYEAGRKDAGTYKVTVKMMGKYTGTKTLTFTINPIDISTCNVKLSATSFTYDGSIKAPAVTVRNSYGTKLTDGKHYTVSYSGDRKNVGSYNVVVTMMGNYTGTKTLTFKLNPPGTTVASLSVISKMITVAVSQQTNQASGYEIQYATNSDFTDAKSKTINSNIITRTTLSGLKGSTTYYVRVRTYKTVNDVKYYSDWSEYKTAKTK